MMKIAVILCALLSCGVAKLKGAATGAPHQPPLIATKKFQVNFLNEITSSVDKVSTEHLNAYLQKMQDIDEYAPYIEELKAVQNDPRLEHKILFIKQLLDIKQLADQSDETFYTLRNVNFLGKIQLQIQSLQEASARELEQMRFSQLCKALEKVNLENEKKPGPPLAPLTSVKSGNQTVTIDFVVFGRQLYELVKEEGSEIIDDYLKTLRKLLYEVVDEKPEKEKPTTELTKVLTEIDTILNTTDFFAKRQRLYAYLEHKLATDYAEFKSSDHAQQDLALIFAKVHQRELDLFLRFLSSNFEFLEHLQQMWVKLLPQQPIEHLDTETKQLYEVHSSYKDFTGSADSNQIYDAYMQKVKEVYARASTLTEKVPIYELLHNASQNVGVVTLHMMRSKCNEV